MGTCSVERWDMGMGNDFQRNADDRIENFSQQCKIWPLCKTLIHSPNVFTLKWRNPYSFKFLQLRKRK